MRKLLSVKPVDNYKLELTYDNNVKRLFDVKPYMKTGKFRELEDKDKFNNVKVSFDTVAWVNGVDLCPDVLYDNSKQI
ncbi:MAG: DUF2442 domain-containing protein [Candidatus Cloacimonetes bacterium]|jgi:hypothetical protein|nr:DUF2442 domain-containing protein [Candidatus Cloacimonadota bacterium]